MRHRMVSIMLCIPIVGPSFEEAQTQILEAQKLSADSVEFRLDYFQSIDTHLVEKLKNLCKIPVIFTLRKESQGGKWLHSEEDRVNRLCSLAVLNPAYIDLEYDTPLNLAKAFLLRHPEIKFIISFHDFEKTPEDLESIYENMKIFNSNLYKIAVKANSCIDTLRMLSFTKKYSPNIIGISLGEIGQAGRILAPVLGNHLSYCAIQPMQATAPGQLSAEMITEVYNYKSLNTNTSIYGLIGNPIEQSVSHLTHNWIMKYSRLNSVYIKIPVKKEELCEFFILARKLGVQGLSVTMPLKEWIIPLLDGLQDDAFKIGAVNTVCIQNGMWYGYNTDGAAALDAIEKKKEVKNKKVVILGAGGAGKAVAYEAAKRNAQVYLLNRNRDKALDFADKIKCIGGGLDEIETLCPDYEILINCTSAMMPIDPKFIKSKTIAMDIKTTPKKTPFLIFAEESQCTIIYGYEMFINQAVRQFEIWFKNRVDLFSSKEQMLKIIHNFI